MRQASAGAVVQHPGPVIIDVRIEQRANVWPIVPMGRGNTQALEDPVGSDVEPSSVSSSAARSGERRGKGDPG